MNILPKKLTDESSIHLVHTSSPVYPADQKSFANYLSRLKKSFANVEVFESERGEIDPLYLAASEKERLRKFRKALKDVNWLLPISGGTGCGDIVRHINEEDLAKFRKQRPIVTGFSDTTFLINYLYFKLKLQTFHFENADGLYWRDTHELFFDIISGKKESFSFYDKESQWLTSAKPAKPLEGIAIGGNFSTFRDFLDICRIRPRSWEPYILFIEELNEDVEELHRIIIALEARGVFQHITALVVGRIDERGHTDTLRKLQLLFGKRPTQVKDVKNIFEYLISDIISDRIKERDPLYILKIDNFGHGVRKNNLIIPIGAKTIIHPDGKIEFVGPFVE